VDRNLRALKILGNTEVGSSTRTLWITEEERKGIPLMIRKGPGPLVVVSPSGSKPSKNWSPDKFTILCDKLVAEYKSDIVFAGKGELNQEQTMAIEDRMKEKAVSLVNKTTFGQLAALIEQADLLISVDSGPAHIASYLDRPLIVLFGPGDFEQWRPWHRDTKKGVALKAFCQCGTILYKCLEKTHCLDTISPENVFGKAAEFLKKPTEKV
jgi:ADP-heptose:LPS heptosyltransferase